MRECENSGDDHSGCEGLRIREDGHGRKYHMNSERR